MQKTFPTAWRRPDGTTAGSHIFFTDVDGTLLRGAMPIPDAVKAAAGRFAGKGGMVTLATGRSPLSTGWIVRELAIELPCILYSGAVLYDFRTGGIVHSTPLPASTRDCLASVCDLYPDFSVQVYTADRIYLLRRNDLLLKKGVANEIEPNLSAVSDIKGDIFKIVMTCQDVQRLAESGVRVFGGEAFHFAFASRHFVEVVATGACKGSAIAILADMLGIPLANTFAAGDAMTDLPMFKVCAHSFATAGAPQALIDAGARVIPSCEEGGLEMAFDIAADCMAPRAF